MKVLAWGINVVLCGVCLRARVFMYVLCLQRVRVCMCAPCWFVLLSEAPRVFAAACISICVHVFCLQDTDLVVLPLSRDLGTRVCVCLCLCVCVCLCRLELVRVCVYVCVCVCACVCVGVYMSW